MTKEEVAELTAIAKPLLGTQLKYKGDIYTFSRILPAVSVHGPGQTPNYSIDGEIKSDKESLELPLRKIVNLIQN